MRAFRLNILQIFSRAYAAFTDQGHEKSKKRVNDHAINYLLHTNFN